MEYAKNKVSQRLMTFRADQVSGREKKEKKPNWKTEIGSSPN